MIFSASRGQSFREEFTFKSLQGGLVAVPAGDWVLTLERGTFVKQFSNLDSNANTIFWAMTADETRELPYSNLSFRLTMNGIQVASGVLRVN
jgi:hypothetical protein